MAEAIRQKKLLAMGKPSPQGMEPAPKKLPSVVMKKGGSVKKGGKRGC